MERTVPHSPMSGPIPGENYTSDTKNYAWHRPPEYTDLDKAIEAIGKKFMDEKNAYGILTMLEMGVDVASIVEMTLMSGIGGGKWTVDQALLLAGPTSHIICLLAKGYGVKYDLGLEDKKIMPTKAFFDGFKEVDKSKVHSAVSNIDIPTVEAKAKTQGGGMMGAAQAMKASTGTAPAPVGATPPIGSTPQGGNY